MANEEDKNKDLTGILEFAKKQEAAGHVPTSSSGSFLEDIPIEKIENFESLDEYATAHPESVADPDAAVKPKKSPVEAVQIEPVITPVTEPVIDPIIETAPPATTEPPVEPTPAGIDPILDFGQSHDQPPEMTPPAFDSTPEPSIDFAVSESSQEPHQGLDFGSGTDSGLDGIPGITSDVGSNLASPDSGSRISGIIAGDHLHH